MNKKFFLLRGLKMVLFFAAMVSLAGLVVMGLWNHLIPTLFGGPVIHFCQALGLLLLSRILVGGFPGRGRHHGCGHRMHHLSPEEKARMRAAWGKKCRHNEGKYGEESAPAQPN